MARLGPWPVERRVAVAVSGGPDSLALALLASQWARGRAKPLGLVVDHGIRPESAADAAWTVDTLRRFGIPSRTLRLEGLAAGPGLQARARGRRYAALRDACVRAGLLDLLLGHHLADQEETMVMRARAGSGPDGRAGMSAICERAELRLVRPLLGIPPRRLRATLRAASLGWIDDPSNRDRGFARVRLRDEHARTGRALVAPDDPATAAATRARRLIEVAEWCARHVTLREEGVALLPPGPWPASALARIVQALGGNAYPPPAAAIAALAASPRAATLAGVLLRPAGRLGPGFLACREVAALAPPIAARRGAVWDARFRLAGAADPPPGWRLGALGAADAATLRRRSDLPAACLATLPALRDGEGRLRLVPHLEASEFEAIFSPRVAVAPSFFMSAGDG